MRRWVGRGPLVALALSAGAILGDSMDGANPKPEPVAFVLSARQESILLAYPSGRAHPEGPDADDGPTRARPSYPATDGPSWTGGGRHRVWRGCRHVYDPKLGEFIFSSSAGSR